MVMDVVVVAVVMDAVYVVPRSSSMVPCLTAA